MNGDSKLHRKHPTTHHRQVDFEVWKRAHNFFDFETLTPIKAKGYVNPVPVFRPLEQALKDDHNKVRDIHGEGQSGTTKLPCATR